MQNEMFPITVLYSEEFKKRLKHLYKKYRGIKDDVKPVIDQLQSGHFIGDRIPDVKHHVYKMRVKNSDSDKGKRSGYRLIYYVRDHSTVILLAIYSKSEQPDISAAQIKQIIRDQTK